VSGNEVYEDTKNVNDKNSAKQEVDYSETIEDAFD